MARAAIIFDLDGTLWNSVPQLVPAWNQVFEAHPELNIKVAFDDLAAGMGKPTIDIVEGLLGAVPDRGELERLTEEICRSEQSRLKRFGGQLYPGVPECLGKLGRKYDLYVVSNCEIGYLDAFLEAHQVREYFRDTECSERTGRPKGENIRMVMERNRVDRAVYVGDTVIDCQAAADAGIPFIHAAYGFGTINEPVTAICSLTELETAAENLLGKNENG